MGYIHIVKQTLKYDFPMEIASLEIQGISTREPQGEFFVQSVVI